MGGVKQKQGESREDYNVRRNKWYEDRAHKREQQWQIEQKRQALAKQAQQREQQLKGQMQNLPKRENNPYEGMPENKPLMGAAAKQVIENQKAAAARQKININDGTLRYYDSLSDYRRYFESQPEKAYYGWGQDGEWVHGIDGDTAAKYITEGWDEGAKEMSAALDAPSLAVPTETLDFDIAGGYADVGRYLAGDPENMVCWNVDPDRSFAGKRVILYSSMSVQAGVPNDYIINRGRAILASIRTLIESGATVTLYGVHSFIPYNCDKRWTLKVKLYDGSLNYHLGQLAFMLMHPAVQRHLTHEHEARDRKLKICDVGPLCDLRSPPEPNSILFPQVDGDHEKWGTFEKACDLVTAMVDLIGRTPQEEAV